MRSDHRLGCLLAIDKTSNIIALIAAVVVPAALASVIIIPQNHGVNRSFVSAGIFDRSHPMELLAHSFQNNCVLFSAIKLRLVIKVQFVVILVNLNHLRFFHVYTDW